MMIRMTMTTNEVSAVAGALLLWAGKHSTGGSGRRSGFDLLAALSRNPLACAQIVCDGKREERGPEHER